MEDQESQEEAPVVQEGPVGQEASEGPVGQETSEVDGRVGQETLAD